MGIWFFPHGRKCQRSYNVICQLWGYSFMLYHIWPMQIWYNIKSYRIVDKCLGPKVPKMLGPRNSVEATAPWPPLLYRRWPIGRYVLPLPKWIMESLKFFISLQGGFTRNQYGNVIPALEKNRVGFFPIWVAPATNMGKKFSSWVTNGTFYFPHEWLSRSGENKFPHEWRSHEWGNLFSPLLLSHSWGK